MEGASPLRWESEALSAPPLLLCPLSARSSPPSSHPLQNPVLSPAHSLYRPVPAAWRTAPHPILPLTKSCSSFGCQDTGSFFLSVPHRHAPSAPFTPTQTHAPASLPSCLCELALRPCAPSHILPVLLPPVLDGAPLCHPAFPLPHVDETPHTGPQPPASPAAAEVLGETAWKALVGANPCPFSCGLLWFSLTDFQ